MKRYIYGFIEFLKLNLIILPRVEKEACRQLVTERISRWERMEKRRKIMKKRMEESRKRLEEIRANGSVSSKEEEKIIISLISFWGEEDEKKLSEAKRLMAKGKVKEAWSVGRVLGDYRILEALIKKILKERYNINYCTFEECHPGCRAF